MKQGLLCFTSNWVRVELYGTAESKAPLYREHTRIEVLVRQWVEEHETWSHGSCFSLSNPGPHAGLDKLKRAAFATWLAVVGDLQSVKNWTGLVLQDVFFSPEFELPSWARDCFQYAFQIVTQERYAVTYSCVWGLALCDAEDAVIGGEFEPDSTEYVETLDRDLWQRIDTVALWESRETKEEA